MDFVKNKIKETYDAIASQYNELIDHKPHNAYYDRLNTLRLIGDVKDKVILDAACGPGKYAEMLISQGAKVTGFDVSPSMIELAKSRNGSSGLFFVQDLQYPLSQF